jgi:ubiquinone/menaquinone biosynthesis C-methylase UbiE
MMHERRVSGDITRLRSAERVERLEVGRVVQLCLEQGSFINMLDAGTGSGVFAEGFAQRDLEVTGIDVNYEMLPAARSHVPGGRFAQAMVEALPFTRRSFDLVFYGLVLGLVLHESDDPLSVLQSARRVSRKRVCVLEWPYREQPFGPPIDNRLSPTRLETLFQKAGFTSWETFSLTNTSLYRLCV